MPLCKWRAWACIMLAVCAMGCAGSGARVETDPTLAYLGVRDGVAIMLYVRRGVVRSGMVARQVEPFGSVAWPLSVMERLDARSYGVETFRGFPGKIVLDKLHLEIDFDGITAHCRITEAGVPSPYFEGTLIVPIPEMAAHGKQ